MNSLKINMFTHNAYFQYSHRAVSVITAFTLVFSSFVFALPSIVAAAPVPLFSDDFEAPGSLVGWDEVDPQWGEVGGDTHGGVRTARVQGATAPGQDNLRKDISTVGYENIVVSYWYRIPALGVLESSDHFRVQWSTDGSTWNTLAHYTDVGPVGWTMESFALPATAADEPGFQIRFRANFDGPLDAVRIDDIEVTGEAIPVTESSETIVVQETDMAVDFADVLSDLSQWFFYNDETDAIDPALGAMVFGPGSYLGDGSAQISVSGTQRRNLATYQFSGVGLEDIREFKYSTYNPSAGNGGSSSRSGYAQFNVDFDGSDTWQRRLIFLPSDNGSVAQDSWQEWDMIQDGDAKWRYSGPTWPVTGEPGSTTKTWDEILADYPGVSVRTTDSWMGVRVGEPYADGYTENIDKFVIGIQSGYNIHTKTFDFEPIEITNSSEIIVVSPLDLNGWEFNSDRNTWTMGIGEFVAGPDTAPLGDGSARLTTPGTNDRTKLRKYMTPGTQISDIKTLEYSTYRSEPTGGVLALALQFDVDMDGTPVDGSKADGRIVYEPYYTQTTLDDTWQTWDALDDSAGTGTGNWWIAGPNGGPTCTIGNPCTWTELNTDYPDLQISAESLENTIDTEGAVLFKAGGSWAGFDGTVDNFVIGVQSGYNIHTITYDFEPDFDETAPDMPMHLWPEDGAIMPSSFLTHIDWTDVTDVSEPVVYYYESAFSSATSTGAYGDDFTSPIYQSGTLAVSEIPTLGTGEGTYYWHVRAVDDEGNSTPWTAPWSVTVDNTPPDVTVTIVKYIDDEHATAENTGSASFPMHAIFPGGEGNYSLTTTGFNNPNPYEATTSNMPWGSDYSTYEFTSAEGPVYPVGEDCPIDSYRLVGYKTGNTLEQAEADDISTDVPVFEGLMTSKYVIVVNEPCTLGTSQIIQPTESEETSGTTELEAYYADENGDGNDGVQWAVRAGTCAANTGTVFGNVDGKNTPFTWDGTNFNTTIDTTQVLNGSYCFVFNPTEDGGNTNQRLTRLFSINNPLPDVKVHIYKYLEGDETTEQVPDDFEPATTFPMQASWDAENIGAGSGAYVLGNNHGGAALKYAADTSAMTSGADYSTYEDTYPGNGSSNVLAPTESCQVGYYKLMGYKSSTTSLEDAEEASLTTTAPSFTGLESDAYVIVVNKYCGDEPEVTYADEVKMCKVDQNGDELSGWTLYLKGDTVETLNVNANSWLGADSSVLDDYTSYLALVSGTWANQGGANLVDAEYSTTDSWTSYMDGYTGYGTDILDLQFNEGFINWGSYDGGHSYVYGFTPVIDDSVNFRVFDGTDGVQNEGWFNDNTGSLSVEIAKGFIGETDETGCVTFENVPVGTYTVGEISQDGWTNVDEEEDGAVAVGESVTVTGNSEADIFTLMNDNGEEEPVYGSITIVKEILNGEDTTFSFESETLGDGGFDVTTVEGTGTTTFSNLFADVYDVSEIVPEGWELVSAICDDESPIDAIDLAEGENITCTFTNDLIEEEDGPVETFSSGGGGGGNGPVVGSFGAVLGASTGQVLGASTGGLPELPNGCSALVSSYMRRGMNNDPEQVKLLQNFLNGEMGLSVPLTGFFGILTENAVKAFQLKYAEQILAPWGITQPTGYVYKTTQRWINLSHCSTLDIPMPDLSNE